MRVGEPEFAFRMGRDLPPRSSLYTTQQVLDAVDTLHPAIEIPDSRFSDFVSAGAAQTIADNACAHLFVLGPPTTSDWRALDLVEERPLIQLRGQHRPRQERAWRSQDCAGLACQRTIAARHHVAGRPDRDDGDLSPAIAGSVGRCVRGEFWCDWKSVGQVRVISRRRPANAETHNHRAMLFGELGSSALN